MMNMRKQTGAAPVDLGKETTWPKLQLPPPMVNKLNDSVMTQEHIDTMHAWAGSLLGKLQQERELHAQSVADLKSTVDTLKQQISDLQSSKK